MRIIAGNARGRRLIAPAGAGTRPTLDRVRENLFNILAPYIPGASFLDLFAGTGANGLEALSRGARNALLVESDPQVLEIIRKNIIACDFAQQAETLRLILPEGLKRIRGNFDLIFADPPYAFHQYDLLFSILAEKELVAEGGRIVLETARATHLPEQTGPWTQYRRAEYGDTALSFFA